MALIKASQLDIEDLAEHLSGFKTETEKLFAALNKPTQLKQEPKKIPAGYSMGVVDQMLALKSESIHTHKLQDLYGVYSDFDPEPFQVLTFTHELGWIGKHVETPLPPTFNIDIQTEKGTRNVNLPSPWKQKYVDTGKFVLTHNMNTTSVGFMLNVMHDGHAKVINPTKITENAITFQVTCNDQPCDGNVVGKLTF